ncbi:MAG: hypothetical protein CMH57_03570 [Myxococcales bacterium]|nr:hypothetical protein [Myxococcales bacterium]
MTTPTDLNANPPDERGPLDGGQQRPHPHPRFVQWIIFGAALMPFFVTIAYMTFKPAPKMLKRNFPPAEQAPNDHDSSAPDAAAPDTDAGR